jgi:tRNA G10  N-methylase Trm11
MLEPHKPSHLFISGKNWKLSLAELISFLEARGLEFRILECSKDFFVFAMTEPPPESMIDYLGGVLKIAKVKGIVPTKLLVKAYSTKTSAAKQTMQRNLPLANIAENIAASYSGKPFFGISVYWTDSILASQSTKIQRLIGSSIKKELKNLGRSSDFMGFSRERKNLPQLTPVEVLKKGFVTHEAEILFCVGKNNAILGTTIGIHNPFEFQKRDIGKPMQRKIFAMPPRLAKILLNLSHCTPGKIFLDPFCGVGTILQEALLTQATVIGIDTNSWCIVEWLIKEYTLKNPKFILQIGDARKIENMLNSPVDCIATEPDLGPALRQVPTVSYATKIIDELHPLYFEFIRSAYATLNRGGRLVLVTPLIRTRTGQLIHLNIRQAAESAGFKLVHPFEQDILDQNCLLYPSDESLIDIYQKQIVGREIHIFQK